MKASLTHSLALSMIANKTVDRLLPLRGDRARRVDFLITRIARLVSVKLANHPFIQLLIVTNLT